MRLLSEFAERDLVDDFGLKAGVEPRFLMHAASLGGMGSGGSLLVVIETTTRQVAAYRATPRANTLDGRPQFERIERATYDGAKAPAPGPPREPIGASGPILIQQAPDGIQAPLDAVYWIDSDRDATLHVVIPAMQQAVSGSRALSAVGARDLAADFGLTPGSAPRFLLNAVSLGAGTQGSAALVVIETTTKRVAAYQAIPALCDAGGPRRLQAALIADPALRRDLPRHRCRPRIEGG